MIIHPALARIPVSLVLVAALAAALWSGESEARTNPEYCTKVLRIVPAGGGQSRPMEVKKGRNEFTAAERKVQEADDDYKYNDFKYTRIGPASQFIDCAGTALQHLFGAGPYVVSAGTFFSDIVLPFGTVVFRSSARKDDIVVFQTWKGTTLSANHIAHIVAVDGGTITIETKDGKESVYRTRLPTDDNDPLIQAHGRPSIYRVEPGRIKVEVVDDGPCDPITVVYAPPKGDGSTDARPPGGGSSGGGGGGPGSSSGDAPQGGGTPPGTRTGARGTQPQPPGPTRPPGGAGNNPGGPPSSTPPAPPTNVAGLPPKPGTPGAPSTPGSPPYTTHLLSQPFTPGGQCPKVVSNPVFGPMQTAFESCQWNDPKQGGPGAWVGCVTETDMNFVCKSSNAPPTCKCTQDWSGKVPGLEQLVALAPAKPGGTAATPQMMRSMVTPAESQMAGLGPPPEPSANDPMGGLGPPPDPQKQTPPDNTPMGGLGPPPDPQQHNPPAPAGSSAAPQGSAAATPQGPIFIPVPVAPPSAGNRPPPNVCHQKSPPNICHPKSPPNVCHQKPGSGTSAGTNPGTRIGDTWDTQPKPGDTKPQPAGTAVMNSGTCHLDQSTGIRTCKDTQGRTCTTKAGFCDPAKTAQAAPPPASGPLKLKPRPETQLAKLDEPKTPAAPATSIPACESKAPYLPWGGQGTASITVSGGKPCGVGWHDTGATILENITVTSRPAHGTVTPKNKNEVIFTPASGYKGQDSFKLRMQERNGGRRATLTVTVNVTIR